MARARRSRNKTTVSHLSDSDRKNHITPFSSPASENLVTTANLTAFRVTVCGKTYNINFCSRELLLLFVHSRSQPQQGASKALGLGLDW